jgi:acyl transferase domain-containing protein
MGGMAVVDEYRRQAERCRMRAEGPGHPADHAFWLLLAEKWQMLAQASEQQRDELEKHGADPADVTSD